jgi:hypothetical protein
LGGLDAVKRERIRTIVGPEDPADNIDSESGGPGLLDSLAQLFGVGDFRPPGKDALENALPDGTWVVTFSKDEWQRNSLGGQGYYEKGSAEEADAGPQMLEQGDDVKVVVRGRGGSPRPDRVKVPNKGRGGPTDVVVHYKGDVLRPERSRDLPADARLDHNYEKQVGGGGTMDA